MRWLFPKTMDFRDGSDRKGSEVLLLKTIATYELVSLEGAS